MRSLPLLAALCLALPLAVASTARADESRPNVLFIAVDDLRPEIGAYGEEHIVTPNMDRLAEQGRRFTRHYVQVPTCGASRYALLTGQLPVREATWHNNAFKLYQQSHAPPSFPQLLREHGYRTIQMGKVSHSPDGLLDDGNAELPHAWNELTTPAGEWQTSWNAFFGYAGGETRTRGESPPLESADVDDRGYPDGLIADAAVQKLHALRDEDQPFFFAVGFYKPHLPFTAPQKYWDLYERDAIDISDVDPVRRTGGEFFGNYGHAASDAADPDYVRKLRHGYYAATSYTDAQVGKVLAALDELGLADNTIVILWGDHGYHLGELGFWGKHTLHEHALRSAFIVRMPDRQQPGVAADAVTSTVDIYPTLLDLLDLPQPDHLDGHSFAALLQNPDAQPAVDHALGFWADGYSLRTDRYRLIRRGDDARLYDHQNDPGETTDIAADHPDLLRRLSKQLDAHLAARKALPDDAAD